MMLTFNAPTEGRPKQSRMSHTNTKNFGTHTPNPMRKASNHTSNKKTKIEGDFLVVGHQAEMKQEWGYEENRHKGWGVRRRDNKSFKL